MLDRLCRCDKIVGTIKHRQIGSEEGIVERDRVSPLFKHDIECRSRSGSKIQSIAVRLQHPVKRLDHPVQRFPVLRIVRPVFMHLIALNLNLRRQSLFGWHKDQMTETAFVIVPSCSTPSHRITIEPACLRPFTERAGWVTMLLKTYLGAILSISMFSFTCCHHSPVRVLVFYGLNDRQISALVNKILG